MIKADTFLYLSRADIEALALSPQGFESAIEGAYRARCTRAGLQACRRAASTPRPQRFSMPCRRAMARNRWWVSIG